MPNTYIYIVDGGVATDVYKMDAASPYCLFGSALCPLGAFSGRGSF